MMNINAGALTKAQIRDLRDRNRILETLVAVQHILAQIIIGIRRGESPLNYHLGILGIVELLGKTLLYLGHIEGRWNIDNPEPDMATWSD